MRLLRSRKVKIVFNILLLLSLATGGVLYYFLSQLRAEIQGSVSSADYVEQFEPILSHYTWTILLTPAVAALLAIIVYLFAERLQSRKVNRFQKRIERNLHGKRDLGFEEFREGEFASLEASIHKMVNANYAQKEELQEEKETLVEALSQISHQIKTPLAVISLTAQSISDPKMNPLERELRIQRMQDRIENIGFLIRSLLDVSRLDAGVARMRSETFSAQELIRMACNELLELIEDKDLVLQTRIEPGICLQGDKRWLTQALANIIKNCIEHTQVGGKIFIEATKMAVCTKIEIRDTGCGIDPEDLPHIFELYHKGKDASSSSVGIGLYLSRKVIHEAGGTITAANSPQGGAVFTIRLNEINV